MPSSHPRDHAAATPDRPAIVIAGGAIVTYRELADRSAQLARVFATLELQPGDGVAALMENHPRYFDALWATHDAALYFTPLSTLLTPPELAYILNDSGARVLVTTVAQAAAVAAVRPLAPGIEQVLMFDGGAAGAIDADAIVAAQSAVPLPAGVVKGGLLLYSSGTTGVPKGIKPALRHVPPEVPPALAALLVALYGIDRDTVYLSPAPLYHTAPLKWNMTVQIAGGTSVIMTKFDAGTALALIEQHRVTHSQWVPTMFQRLLRLPAADKARDLSSHRVAVHAAAPCPPAVKHAMIEWWGPILHEYYAGTESNGLTALDSAEWMRHPGSVGRTMRGGLHVMADDGETELPTGTPGLIYFDGGTPFEYHGDAAKTAASRNSRGWTTIGDIGFVDGEGFLYLTDRRDDVIIAGGVNIYPQEIEKLLAAHPLVLDVAVLGVPAGDLGEEVKAVVQLAEGAPDPAAAADALRFWLAPQLARFKQPRSYDFVAELPRLPTGKLLKRVLREHYWGSSAAVAAITANDRKDTAA